MSQTLLASLLLIFTTITSSTLLSQEQIWYRSYKGIIFDIERLPNDDLLLVGSSLPFKAVPSAHYSGYVARVDTAGSTIWERPFSSYYEVYPRMIHRLASGNFLVIGNGRLKDGSSLDYYVATLDSNGLLITEQLIQDSNDQYTYAVKQLPDGGFLAVGPTGFRKAIIGKFDSVGNHLWTKGYERSDTVDSFSDAVILPDGRILVTGESFAYKESSILSQKTILWMFSDAGDSLWVRDIDVGPIKGDQGRAIFRRGDGGFIVIGTESGFGALLRLDSTGVLESRTTFQNMNIHTEVTFARSRDSVIEVYGVSVQKDPFFGVLSFSGDLLHSISYSTVTKRWHYPSDDFVDPSGNRYIAGQRNGENYAEGFLLKVASGRSGVYTTPPNPWIFGLW